MHRLLRAAGHKTNILGVKSTLPPRTLAGLHSLCPTSVTGAPKPSNSNVATSTSSNGGSNHDIRANRAAWSHQFSRNGYRFASTTATPVRKFVSEDILAHVPKVQVNKVLVVGSGGLSIGQAGEFDYSGSQAIKALKEANIHTVLVNPNIATIQTSQALADTIYFLPVTPEYLEYIIEREKPDGILLTFGGQSGLNCGIALDKMGVLRRHNVQVLGTPVQTLITSEDRDLFAKALQEIDIPVAQSVAVETVQDALDAAAGIGYPVIVRSAFSLGGLGSGFASDEDSLRQLATSSLSLTPQILVEKSMLEYEVVRDAANNCITVCNMENFDPLGTHTGDSIVVAPSQTLTDEEYHMLRTAAIKIVRHMGVVGECNVQYALNPEIIEMNARLSRSSALASKATGYPLAFIAAKIALGYTLPELQNAVTKSTTACFEPSLDYIVTKIPRWDLSKFNHVSREVGSCMKSVGEVMAIGRTFEESLQKAVRQVDPSFSGFQSLPVNDLDDALSRPTDRRLFHVGYAMIEKGYSIDRVHELTRIDKWFLYKLDNIVQTEKKLSQYGLDNLPVDLLHTAKKHGFSDAQIAKALNPPSTEDLVRATRKSANIIPRVKRIDTLAAEFPLPPTIFTPRVYRIGSSVEFDWCGVSCVRALRQLGHKTVVVNYNPETVSTDFDECDRLYFEELSYERVMDIYEREKASGVVAEDRYKFSQILDRIGVDQPEWKELTIGYPVLVRPSYVLSGAAMNVAHDATALKNHLSAAATVSPLHPVVVTKFIAGAQEIDIDAVAHQGSVLCHAQAGVHSGDATLILPSRELPTTTLDSLKEITGKVAKAFEITGPFNMQVIRAINDDGSEQLRVIECNLRASRSFPFVSKVLGVNFIDVATHALCNESRDYQAISWTRLAGADPFLGVEMSSTGEVACFGKDKHEAYLAAIQSTTGFRLPVTGHGVLLGRDHLTSNDDFVHVARVLNTTLGHPLFTDVQETADYLPASNPMRSNYLSLSDKRALQKELKAHQIDFCINLARDRPTTTADPNYGMRRAAVDFGIPLVNDAKCARLFVDALAKKHASNETSKQGIPSEVRSWSDFVTEESI
ncbi:hypothetical protein BDF22DRAFT_693127 [Syncephalis plumigaleata]|nr:hypothetical protein BDF22DRAFT_693127 [Syncephalis plumigaleata]